MLLIANRDLWLRDKIWEWPGDEAKLTVHYNYSFVPRPLPAVNRARLQDKNWGWPGNEATHVHMYDRL